QITTSGNEYAKLKINEVCSQSEKHHGARLKADDQYEMGQSGARNNLAKAHHTLGFLCSVLHVFSKEAEKYDPLQVTCCLQYRGPLDLDHLKLVSELDSMSQPPLLHGQVCNIEIHWCPKVSLPPCSGAHPTEMRYQEYDVCIWSLACQSSPSWYGSYHTASAMYSSKMTTKEAEEQVTNIQNKNASHIVEFFLNNVKPSVYDIPQRVLKMASALMRSSTSNQDMFQKDCAAVMNNFICEERFLALEDYLGHGVTDNESNRSY
ncbi:hypothetical protein IFM89_024412, partial [Coptis chinensis]